MNLSTRFQLSNNLNRFDQKLEAILDKKVEIILLQDVRLGPEGDIILRKRLEFNKYGSFDTFTNSTKASKINFSRHNNIMAFEIRITILIHNKDDIEFVTAFPCFLGHSVPE